MQYPDIREYAVKKRVSWMGLWTRTPSHQHPQRFSSDVSGAIRQRQRAEGLGY